MSLTRKVAGALRLGAALIDPSPAWASVAAGLAVAAAVGAVLAVASKSGEIAGRVELLQRALESWKDESQKHVDRLDRAAATAKLNRDDIRATLGRIVNKTGPAEA